VEADPNKNGKFIDNLFDSTQAVEKRCRSSIEQNGSETQS